MGIKDISIEEIIYAFKTFKKRIDICRYFGTKQSQSRFIKALCEKANINPDDYIDPVYKSKIIKGECKLCGKEFFFKEKEKRCFCSHTCSTIYNNNKRNCGSTNTSKKEKKYCVNCNKEIPSARTFCSTKCQNEYKHKKYIESWKNGDECGYKGLGQISSHIKRYLLEKTKCSCEICGCNWINPKSGKPIVEIHHKDGNPYNNAESNLQVLCPNHHAMTENYKNNNNNKGRKIRKNIKE